MIDGSTVQDITVFAPVHFVTQGDEESDKQVRLSSKALAAALREFEECTEPAEVLRYNNQTKMKDRSQYSMQDLHAKPPKKKKWKMQFIGSRPVCTCSAAEEAVVRAKLKEEHHAQAETAAKQRQLFTTLNELQEHHDKEASAIQKSWMPHAGGSKTLFKKLRQEAKARVDCGQNRNTNSTSTPVSGTFTPLAMSDGLGTPLPPDFPPDSTAASVSRMINGTLEENIAKLRQHAQQGEEEGEGGGTGPGAGTETSDEGTFFNFEGTNTTTPTTTTTTKPEQGSKIISDYEGETPLEIDHHTTQHPEDTHSVHSDTSRRSRKSGKSSVLSGAGGGVRVREVVKGRRNKHKTGTTNSYGGEEEESAAVPAEFYTFQCSPACMMPTAEDGTTLTHLDVLKRERQLRILKRNKEQAEAFQVHANGMHAERKWNTVLTQMQVDKMVQQNQVHRRTAGSLARQWLKFKEEEQRENDYSAEQYEVDKETIHADNRWMQQLKDTVQTSSTQSTTDGYDFPQPDIAATLAAEAQHQRKKWWAKTYMSGGLQEVQDTLFATENNMSAAFGADKPKKAALHKKPKTKKSAKKGLQQSQSQDQQKKASTLREVEKQEDQEHVPQEESLQATERTEACLQEDVQPDQNDQPPAKPTSEHIVAATTIQCMVRQYLARRIFREVQEERGHELLEDEMVELEMFAEEGGFQGWE